MPWNYFRFALILFVPDFAKQSLRRIRQEKSSFLSSSFLSSDSFFFSQRISSQLKEKEEEIVLRIVRLGRQKSLSHGIRNQLIQEEKTYYMPSHCLMISWREKNIQLIVRQISLNTKIWGYFTYLRLLYTCTLYTTYSKCSSICT